jgi:hypothetical protein
MILSPTETGGMGIGATTKKVLTHPDFLKDPKACATVVWEASRYSLCIIVSVS